MKTIELTFDGYWREINKGGVPSKSGVYCVYSCLFDRQSDRVSIKKLIYVGESSNVRLRITGHERLEDWKRHLRSDETLCYSFAPISDDRDRAEAAIIYMHEPPENTEYAKNFPFSNTLMKLYGETIGLETEFLCART